MRTFGADNCECALFSGNRKSGFQSLFRGDDREQGNQYGLDAGTLSWGVSSVL